MRYLQVPFFYRTNCGHFFLVRSMMYGFGDDPDPAPDTVNVMEEILMEYIADVVSTIRLGI